MEPIASASTSRTTITSISKVATNEMRKICSKHSELLLKLKRCKPSALPETYSYKDKSSTKLAADEHAMIETLQINSPPTYQWKEIEFTLKTNTKKPVLKNHPSNKADLGVKKADDSGFLENIQDFSQASSNMHTTIESTSQKKETNKGNKSVNSIHKGKGPQTKKVSVKKADSVEICPICGEKFPVSLIEEHAAGCDSEDVEVFEVTPTKRSERPDRLAKTNARKRLRREARVDLTSSSSIHRITALEDTKGADREVDVESLDDDVVMIRNASSSGSLKKTLNSAKTCGASVD